MDFLQFHPSYRVLICTYCKYALIPNTVASHLRDAHKGQLSRTEIKDYLQIVNGMCLKAPELVQRMEIPPSNPPAPHLVLYLDGIACRLCECHPYVCRSKRHMRAYLTDHHAWTSGEKGGRPSKASRAATAALETSFSKVTSSPIAWQVYHLSSLIHCARSSMRDFNAGINSAVPASKL